MFTLLFDPKNLRFSFSVSIFGLCFLLPCLGQRNCEPLSISFCHQFRYNWMYNTTILPNILGHKTQEEAANEIRSFFPLVHSGCSRNLALFICSVYAPICTVSHKQVPPCRSLCNSVRNGCEVVMKSFRLPWPASLNCNRFPKTSEEICVGVETATRSRRGKF